VGGITPGIYTDVGPKTCAGWEGSFGHDEVDAKTYAEWGIDFVEEDSCHHAETAPTKGGKPVPYETLYGRMRDALNKTGRDIVFYMCVQGQEAVQEWGPR
jgi:alpha-galactosidase